MPGRLGQRYTYMNGRQKKKTTPGWSVRLSSATWKVKAKQEFWKNRGIPEEIPWTEQSVGRERGWLFLGYESFSAHVWHIIIIKKRLAASYDKTASLFLTEGQVWQFQMCGKHMHLMREVDGFLLWESAGASLWNTSRWWWWRLQIKKRCFRWFCVEDNATALQQHVTHEAQVIKCGFKI